MDFGDAPTLAALVTDGVDADGDHRDDITGQAITYYANAGDTSSDGHWVCAYRPDAWHLPLGWRLAASVEALGAIGPINPARLSQGYPVTRVAFDGTGRILGLGPHGQWLKFPLGSDGSATTSADGPFWAVYFVAEGQQAAVAVALHPSGLIERFRYDPAQGWRGFARRQVTTSEPS